MDRLRTGIAIARSCIRGGARVRFYDTTDLANWLELEAHQDRAGKLAEHLSQFDLLVLDELGYLPFARTGGQLPRSPTVTRFEP